MKKIKLVYIFMPAPWVKGCTKTSGYNSIHSAIPWCRNPSSLNTLAKKGTNESEEEHVPHTSQPSSSYEVARHLNLPTGSGQCSTLPHWGPTMSTHTVLEEWPVAGCLYNRTSKQKHPCQSGAKFSLCSQTVTKIPLVRN